MSIQYTSGIKKSTNVRFLIEIQHKILKILFTTSWFVSRSFTKQVVKRLFFRPARYIPSAAQKKMFERSETFEFVSGGQVLKGYKWGEGPAVVFVHGWSGCGIQFHIYIRELVDSGFSVWVFDQAAHGASEGKTANYFKFSDAIYDFIRSRPNLVLHTLVGHSFGASAIINYLWRTKTKPNTILIAPALNIKQMLTGAFKKFGVPQGVLDELLSELEISTGHDFEKEIPAKLIRFLNHDILIVHDTNDKAIPYEESWQAGMIQENISLFPTKGMGHIRILEDPSLAGELTATIREFKGEYGQALPPVADHNPGDDHASSQELM